MPQTAARHMAESPFGTATCTVCWRVYSLTRAGNLRSHNRPDAAWNAYAGMCVGARKPPGAVMRTTAVDLRGHRDHYGPGLAAYSYLLAGVLRIIEDEHGGAEAREMAALFDAVREAGTEVLEDANADLDDDLLRPTPVEDAHDDLPVPASAEAVAQ